MGYCVVKGCCSYKEKNVKLKSFTFPKDPEIRKLWISACGSKKVNFKTGRICSKHFTDNDWRLKDILLNTPFEKRFLDPKAVPSLYIHENSKSTERKNRATKRTNKKIVQEALERSNLCLQEHEKENEPLAEEINENEQENEFAVAVQTELDYECSEELSNMSLEKELEKYKNEIIKLKQENQQLRNLENSVQHIFTSGQIKKLRNPEKKINWNLDDISAAKCLHSAGPQAYKFLYKKKFPLPPTSILREYAKKIDVRPGILHQKVIKLKIDIL